MDAPTFLLEKPTADYTMICNALLRDRAISLRAKGLYGLMFSKPNGWIFHEAALLAESAEGRDAMRAAMKELLARGWVQKIQPREGGKFAGVSYRMHLTVDWKSGDGSTGDGKSTTNKTDISKTEGVSPSISPKPTKAPRREPSPLRSLDEFLQDSGGEPPITFGHYADTLGWSPEFAGKVWERFARYWRSPDAKGSGRKRDWFSTWQNWCDREAANGGGRSGAGGRSLGGLAAALGASMASRGAVPGANGSHDVPGSTQAGGGVHGLGDYGADVPF